MFRWMAKGSVLACAVVLLTGCQSQETDPKNLRIYLPGDPTSLNPQLGIDRRCRMIQGALLEGLTRVGPEGEAELALASEVELSEDQRTYLFHLRDSVWSNGKKMTAIDFERSWKRAIHPMSDCRRADLFYLIKNGMKIKKGELPLEAFGVRAIDDQTLRVDLECIAPYFLEVLATPIFFPVYEDEGEFIGNGPFCLLDWKPEKKIELIANPTYWDAKQVKLKKIDIAIVRDENTVLLMYEKGELDWAGRPFRDLPAEATSVLEAQGRLRKTRVNEVFWLALNTDHVPLNSPSIRKALSISIDRKKLAKHVLGGNIPTRTLFPEKASLLGNEKLYQDGDELWAKRLFDKGLSELGLSRETMPPLIINHSDQLLQRKMAQALAQEWEKCFGIQVLLHADQWPVLFSKLNTKQYCIGGCWWWAIHSDPICQLEMFKNKSCDYNITDWEDKEYEKLLDLAHSETDPSVRKELLVQAEALFLENMPVIPLVSHQFKYLAKERVKGVVITPTGQIDFKWATLN